MTGSRSSSVSSSSSSSSDTSGDVTMEDARLADVSMDNDQCSDSPSNQSDDGHEPLTTAAKFKAAQDLRIQTSDLLSPSTTAETKERASSVGSDSVTASTSSTESSSKTPLPPSSTGKKRRRRTAAQIDRKFPCTYPGCTKAYGSEGSLTQHQRLKHRNQPSDQVAALGHLSGFFSRTPRSLPVTIGRGSGPGSAKTVTIRPAGLDPSALSMFDMAVASTTLATDHDSVSGDFLLSSSSAELISSGRQHLRARSNSMPVSYSTPTASPPPYLPPPSPLPIPSTAKPQSTRRSRTGSTPRAAKPPLRRTKSRSKSESMNEFMEPFEFHATTTDDSIRPPVHARSASDSVGFGLMFGSKSSGDTTETLPFTWASAVGYPHTESPPSSAEEAIDSDILSVLADYDDTSDTGDSTLEFVGAAPGSTDKVEDWLSQPDAIYLTASLQKMTMVQDAGGVSPHGDNNVKLEMLPSDSKLHSQYPPNVNVESFAMTSLDRDVKQEDTKVNVKLEPQEFTSSTAGTLFPTPTDQLIKSDNQQSAAAAMELAGLENYTSMSLDQAQYMDVDSSSFGPMLWKTEKRGTLSAPPPTMDALSAYLQQGEKASGYYFTLGDTIAMDGGDYAMEEPRLSSPVVIQQNDL